jgi:DNA-directed RNA polymerase subunit M/transcription elongation factor TFIIS
MQNLYKIPQPEAFRNNIKLKLGELLDSTDVDKSSEMYQNIVTNMERGIFNYSLKEAEKRNLIKKWENPSFVHLYVDRLRSLYMNLKANRELCKQIIQNEILPQQLAFMTHQQYNPDKWKELIEQKLKREASKFTTNIQASTDVYECKRCKSRKCVYYEQQVRSADESMTIFVTCLDCGKQWKC